MKDTLAEGAQEFTLTGSTDGGAGATAGEVAELRTFLFADVRGYTRFTQDHGDEMAARLVERFAAVTKQAVQTRGGQFLELRGDEVLAVFGSARQAIRAAVDAQARYARETEAHPDTPLRVGIGIDAGEAVPIEGGFRGEALNLAARLCNLANPGEVLATEGVVYLGRQVQGVGYAERGLVPIKGFADPVRVIRVVRVADEAGRTVQPRASDASNEPSEPAVPIGVYLGALPSGVLIGRENEWAEIMSWLEAVLQGTGHLGLLSGEPGIGKTRLAQEVTLKAQHWGFLVATGRCYQQEQNVPYYPFLESLNTLFDRCHPSIRSEIPRRWPYLGRILPEQVGIIPSTAEEHEDQYLLFRAVTGFITAIAEMQPVALLLDDLHWADDSSVRLLQHLARHTRGHRVLLFGTYRDVEVHRQHPLEAALVDLAREGLVDEVGVRRLDQAGTEALMREILGEKEDLSDVADLLYRRTEGNAFYVGEMLRALVERGDLYREDGHWAARELRDMEVPKSIRSIIGQRLDRLEERAQEILRDASVLGQELAFDDLLAIRLLMQAGRSVERDDRSAAWLEDDVEGALEQGLVAGLLRRTERGTYAFNHGITQQALYAELAPRRQRRLHRAAGEALQNLPEKERERRAGELAWHFLQGDDPVLALHYSLVAARYSENVFANREADGHYRTAHELARELGDMHAEVAALEGLGGVLTIGARYDRALSALDEAAALYRELGDQEGEARVVAQSGYVYYLQGPAEDGIERIRPLVEAMEGAGRPSFGLASLWSSLARLYLDIADHERGLEAAERALDVAGRLPSQPGLDRVMRAAEVSRSSALWRVGEAEEALRVMEDVIPRAEAAADLDNLVRALGNAASYYARRGEFDKDRLYSGRMLAVAEQRGDRGNILLAAMALSTNHFVVGNWAESRRLLERAETIVRALGTTRLAIWPMSARAWLLLREGDLEGAARKAEEGLALTGGTGDAEWRWNLQRVLAERSRLLGEHRQAIDRLEPILEESGWKRHAGLLAELAWCYRDAGRLREAKERASQSVEAAQRRGSAPDMVDALVARAVVSSEDERWDQAIAGLEEALEGARRLPYPFAAGRTLYEMGMLRARRSETTQARDLLKQASEVFAQLGARFDATRAQAAEERLVDYRDSAGRP